MNRLYRDLIICLLLATPMFFLHIDRPLTPRLALSLLIIAPIAEEIIFRGFIQGVVLGKLKPIAAILATSALFAFAHWLVNGNILVFFPSLALSAHYALHRSLPAVVFIHFFYNVSLFI